MTHGLKSSTLQTPPARFTWLTLPECALAWQGTVTFRSPDNTIFGSWHESSSVLGDLSAHDRGLERFFNAVMGASWSILSDAFPPKPQFKVEDIPDLTGRVVLVTGANTGVGRETAKALLAHNAKVYLAARNEAKTKRVIEELKAETGNEGLYLKLDLADLNSVKQAAEEFLRKEQTLHVLFNNAGVMRPPIEDVTVQGYDLQFGTNVLGHFYFTKLLIPALLNGARSSTDGKARIIHTSSSTSYRGFIDFKALKDGPARRRYSSSSLYDQSKLGNALVSQQWAKRYGDKGIVSVAVNPGNLSSELTRHLPGWQATFIRWTMLYPVPLGALTQLYAGTMDEGADLNGKWMIPWARVAEHPNPLAHDDKLGDELWRWCEDQVANI
ncbi:hypothetical protein NMY22_g8559 [Coprinellus aureogranulatus]|nr:hypothetical protein NMY22_g8559 [Coprinellus aureogranulatus]